MKKQLLFLSLLLSVSLSVFAGLTGTKSIPGTDADQYPTLAAAIADLNVQGVGPGGVTFNIARGYTETFSSPLAGYITTTGTQSNPVMFRAYGESGNNPLITAATGTGTMDAIITINGGDYITFEGIDLAENSANITATTEMEWGYAILKVSATDGSQNITIRNCTISLTKTYTASTGIYSNNHTSASTTAITVTNTTGTNSNIKIYSNTINNCYTGISFTGYSDPNSPYLYYDQNNEIGKDGANTITNVAGQASTAGYGIYGKAQNNITVANSIITSTMSGSGSPSAIYLTSATNGSANIFGNYISMQFSGTGTVQMNGIFCDMGASGTNNTLNVYNNNITGCTYPTMTTGAGYLMSFTNMATTMNIYGNTVNNNTFGASGVTATGTIRYAFFNASPTTTGPVEFHDNIVSGNSRIQSVVGGGATNLLYITGKGSVFNMYNNQVTNNVLGSNGTAYCLYSGIDMAATAIYDNLVNNISKAEGTTYGLYVYNVTSSTPALRAFRNTITNIEGLTASAVIYGLYSGSSNTIYFYNNMVSDLRATATNGSTSSPDRIYGCYISSTAYAGLYNNSIYLNNTSTGVNFGSVACFSSSSSTKMDVRGNIFVNTSTPSGTTARTMAMKFNYTSLSNFQPLSNYNNFFAGTPGATRVIFYNGTTAYQTLSDYKTLVSPRDLQSVTELPPFMSTSAGSMNLHLQTSVPSQCESGGFPISTPLSILADIDNNPRYPATGFPVNAGFNPNAPDIGADEFGGLSGDITGPAINFTPLSNTYITSGITLTATITDGSGVPTSGTGMPVLYWKINSGTYQAAQGTWVSGNTYTFAFGSGTAIGDIVSYYVAAQDNATVPNVSVYPWMSSSGYSANPPASSTPPTPPATFTILAGLQGTYHVGVGKDYATLTAAAYDISTKYITGPLTLLLDDASYPSETFPVTFVPNPGSSATNLLTIRPNDNQTVAISANSATGILDLTGVDYLVIDGSNKGANTRDLTIENTSTSISSYTIRLTTNGTADPVTNLTIKNSILRIKPKHASAGPALIFSTTVGGGHENLILDNNQISSTFDAIYLRGISGNPIRNLQITNNTIGSSIDSLSVTHMGVYLEYADNTIISNNEIMGPVNGSLNTGQTGINLGSGCTSTKIRNNKIHTFWRSADDGWGATGIWFATADATTVTEISNNLIYDIHSPGVNPGVGQNITYGMFFRSGGNVKILHNTINLTGELSNQFDASSACLGFYYQATGGNFEVRNNILRNGMTEMPGSGNFYGKAYGIMISLPASSMFSIMNNNDYFIDGYNGYIGQKYTNGLGIDAEYQTLASWQAYTGQEAASVTIDPAFTSPTNLIPTTALMSNAGSYIPTVPTDYAGALRSNPPDIGAYEYTADQVVVTSPADAISFNSATLHGMINAAGYTVNSFFDYGLSTSYGNTVSAIPSPVTGSLNTSISAPLTGLLPSTTYHFRARGVTSGGVTVYGEDLTFTTTSAYELTLNVDMSTASGFTPETDQVYVAGNFPGASWNEPGSNPSMLMSRVGSTLTYTLLMYVPAGTYEYKYFMNAGWTGGEYAGGSNRSVSVAASTVKNDTWGGVINWANLQWPGSGEIVQGGSFNVYAQAYIDNGITAATGATYGLQSWIGYSTTNSDPSTWTEWIPAPFSGQSSNNDEYAADLGTVIPGAGTYYYASRFQFGNGAFVYGGFSATGGGYWDGTNYISGVLTVTAPALKTLNVKLFLEGLYAGGNIMNQAMGTSGPQFGAGIADQVKVELHNSTAPYSTAYTYPNINLSINGNLAVTTIPGNISGSYYIVIKHRNSIETWSNTAVSFDVSGPFSHDFTTAASQAYGNNLKANGSVYLVYGGDVNQEGVVDGSDMAEVDNASTNILQGYNPEDVNGDGVADGSDMAVIDNNSTSIVQVIKPE